MRPSWQIDLKWMLGLLACALVAVGGVLFSLSHVTERETAIPVASALVSAGINDRVSDEEYAQVQAAAASSPTSNITLSPISLTFPGGNIAGMTKEQASAYVGASVANVMYDNGAAAAKSLIVTPPPESQQSAVKLGPVGALTASDHDLFTKLFVIVAIVALCLLGCVALLSRGWGRLGAPSFIVAVAIAPLAVAWKAAGSAVGTGDAGESLFVRAARESFNNASGDLSTVFLAIAACAAGAVVFSLLGSALSMMVSKSGGTAAEPALAPAAAAAAAPAPAEAPQSGGVTFKVRQPKVPELKPGMVSGVPQVAKDSSKQQVA
jgi:hypothetical protein